MDYDKEKLADAFLDTIKNDQIGETADYALRGRRFKDASSEALQDRYIELIRLFVAQHASVDTSKERADIDAEFAIRGYDPEVPSELKDRLTQMAKDALARAERDRGTMISLGNRIHRYLNDPPIPGPKKSN